MKKRYFGTFIFLTSVLSQVVYAQSSTVPDWALPGSATHKQIPPPADFHRVTKTDLIPIGLFKGQSDVGSALTPGTSSYNPVKKEYTITSAGYNVWYTRDEFRFLWKKMSGDISLAADINFPDTAGIGDRKAIVIIRQSLDDNSEEAMVALHGGGLLHMAWRPAKAQNLQEMRVDLKSFGGSTDKDVKAIVHAQRIGIEKKGDNFRLFVSLHGEPMHPYGKSVHLHLKGPFYAGIGFCSHHPVNVSSAILSRVILKNTAGMVK